MSDTLYIKNMVCDRCKMVVRTELDKLAIAFETVELGEVLLKKPIEEPVRLQFQEALESLGFEIIEDKSARQVNQIKKTILEWIRSPQPQKKGGKFSNFVSEKLNKDYSSLSGLFSAVEGTTIEQYLIHQKIERAKELLVYDELSLGQIADLLGYSSIQHLSNQFKKITGFNPSEFRKLDPEKNNNADRL